MSIYDYEICLISDSNFLMLIRSYSLNIKALDIQFLRAGGTVDLFGK